MRKSTMMLIAGSVTGLVLASPAFAQSFSGDFGTGNTLPLAYSLQNSAPLHIGSENRREGAAQAPAQVQVSHSDAGSSGYENLLGTH